MNPDHFFFLPFPPSTALLVGALATPPPVSTALPWLAPPPPPPLRFLPCPNVDLSLFFSHRSGSGGGVTPGTTPLGTREARVFLAEGCAGAAVDDEDTIAAVVWAVDGWVGGGLVSNVDVTEAGSASRAWRYSVLMKSRCFCAAVKFVRMSECSSVFWCAKCKKPCGEQEDNYNSQALQCP